MRRAIHAVTGAVMGMVASGLAPAIAHGQVSPVGGHHVSLGGGNGLNASVSGTGGYGAAVPLDLPPPRGDVPLPLSVVYTGTPRVATAGLNWEVPLSYVRLSASTTRRKPVQVFGAGDAAPPRLVMVMSGASMVMVPGSEAGTFTPIVAGAYTTLARDGDGFIARDAQGRTYHFASVVALSDGAVADDSLWLLREIHAPAGADKVVLDYRIDAEGCYAGQPQILLDAVRYTFDASERDALFTIDLRYQTRDVANHGSYEGGWVGLRCESAVDDEGLAPMFLSLGADEGALQSRTHYLEAIDVIAFDNTGTIAGTRVIHAYEFTYEDDPDTGLPRLERVDRWGEGGIGGIARPDTDEPFTATLPVATYEYGSVTQSDAVTFKPSGTVKRNFHGADYASELSGSKQSRFLVPYDDGPGWVDVTKTTHVTRDFNGDGLPDLVYRRDGRLRMVANITTALGTTLASGPEIDLGDIDLHVETVRRVVSEHFITNETWVQYADWNGDGRVDIIDARYGKTASHWLVRINRPHPTLGHVGVKWETRQVYVGYLIDVLTGELGHEPTPSYMATAGYKAIPLSRSRTWLQHTAHYCRQRKWKWNAGFPRWEQEGFGDHETACDDPSATPPPDLGSTDTITEFALRDANGDGYVDVAVNDRPLALPKTDGPECGRGVPKPSDPECHVEDMYPGWSPSPEGPFETTTTCVCSRSMRADFETDDQGYRDADVYVLYNAAGAVLPAGDEAVFTAPRRYEIDEGQTRNDPRCGVERWRTGSSPLFDGNTELSCGLADGTGDGIADYGTLIGLGTGSFRASHGWGAHAPRFETDQHTVCGEGDGTGTYQSRQTVGHVDLTRDGIADLVARADGAWTVAVGTGTGYRRPIPIVTGGADFELSLSVGECGKEAVAIAGITDLDGDGAPELLRVNAAGELEVQSIVGSDGAQGALSAGRLTAIGNGYGARTRISYRSAKTDRYSDHFVPMPEIVVAATHVEVDGRAPGVAELAPTLYAYGDAQMSYDPLLGRFHFAGYRRRVIVRGVFDRKENGYPLEINGFATIEDHAPAAKAGEGFRQRALAGRVTRVSRLEGWFPPDPSALLEVEPRDAAGWMSETALAYEIAPVPHNTAPPSTTDECLDFDPYGDPGFGGTGGSTSDPLCRMAAVVYVKSQVSREGTAWAGTANITSASSVEEVDDYGRPVRVRQSGDVRRPDDDRCIVTRYAEPVTGEAEGLALPHSVRTTNCGATTHGGAVRVLQGVRYAYDGLPSDYGGGQVRDGAVTARVVERYDLQTGTLLGEQAESLGRDGNPFGRVSAVERERVADGTTYSQRIALAYDRFGLAPRTVTVTATGAATLATHYTASTFPSIPDEIVGPNGERTRTYFDHFTRPMGTSVVTDGVEYAIARTSYTDGPVGRSVRSVGFPDATLWSAASDISAGAQIADTYIDAAGRVLYSQSQLGSDYGGKALVAGLTHYDAFGRPTFVADTFEADGSFQRGDEGSAYGTTTIYDDRGRVRRSLRGAGELPSLSSTRTSFAEERYPTTYQYLYEHGQLVTRVRGPNENLQGKPQYLAYRETRATAIGWLLEETYVDGGTALERTRYDYDRLGQQTHIRRYPEPASVAGPVVWETHRDSLGNVLSAIEPGTTPRRHEYDSWGNLVEVWWMDGATGRVHARSYDGLGRVTHSRLLKRAGIDELVESSVRYHYDAPAAAHAGAEHLLGRLAYVEADGVMDTFFSYDELGRQAWAVRQPAGDAPAVRESQVLEPSGRTRSIGFAWNDRAEEILYAYDSAGRVAHIAAADGTARTLFEAPGGGIDGLGRYRRIHLGNGVIEQNSFAPTANRELLEQQWTTADRTIERFYQYRPADGVTDAAAFDATGRERVVAERHDFFAPSAGVDRMDATLSSYDPLGRLTRSTTKRDGALRRDESFAHDPLGNLRSRTDHLGKDDWTFSPSGIDPDRLCRAYRTPTPLSGGVLQPKLGIGFLTVGNPSSVVRAVPLCTHVYDGAGNVTRIAVTTTDIREFSYDSASRLASMRRGGISASLGYDGLGDLATLKVQTDAGGVRQHETRYGGLVERRFIERENRHVMVRRVPGPVGLVAELRSEGLDDGIIYFHGDHTANRWFTDEDGAVVQEVEYGPFGRIHGDTGDTGSLTETRTLWNGGDALADFGVTRLGARIYNPLTGRFLQRDPLVLPLGSVGSHPYSFAFGDPVNLTDTTGLNPIFDWISTTVTQGGPGTSNFGFDFGTQLGINTLLSLDNLADALDVFGRASGNPALGLGFSMGINAGQGAALAYREDGVSGVINYFNPIYHGLTSAYDAKVAFSEGRYLAGAGNTLLSLFHFGSAVTGASGLARAATSGLSRSVVTSVADDFVDDAIRATDRAADVADDVAAVGRDSTRAATGTGPRLLNDRRGNLLQSAEAPQLRNAIENLFRRGAKVGDGSTMDAVRFEQRTGQMLSPRGHAQKLIDRRRQLLKLRRNPNLSASDQGIVHELLADIQDALGSL